MPEARQTRVCAILKLKLIAPSHFAIKPLEGDPTQKDRADADDPLPLPPALLVQGPVQCNSPREQGRPSGSSGQAHTKSEALAKHRWVQPPLFTPQAFVPRGRVGECLVWDRIRSPSLALLSKEELRGTSFPGAVGQKGYNHTGLKKAYGIEMGAKRLSCESKCLGN